MSAHVLLNLLNKLGKRDKMWGLSSILSLFRNEYFEISFLALNIIFLSLHVMYATLLWMS